MSQTGIFNGIISKSIYFINPFAFVKVAFSLCTLHHLSFFESLLHKDFLIYFFAVVFVENIYCFNGTSKDLLLVTPFSFKCKNENLDLFLLTTARS